MMRLLGACVPLVIFLMASTVFAGAKEHFKAGQDYYSQGRYEKAIEEFEEAYRLDPRPLLLFNIAQTYEKMGNVIKAIEMFKKYLAADPDTEERESLLNKIANLEARLAKTGITVNCNVDGAAIFVDKVRKGTTPSQEVITLTEATHKIEVFKPGYEKFVMTIAVAPGQTIPVEAVLEPQSGVPVPPPDAEPEGGEPVAAAETKPAQDAAAAPADGEALALTDWLPWTIAGVGGAGAIAGWGVIGTMALMDGNHDQAVLGDIVGGAGAVVAAAGLGWGLYTLFATDETAASGPTTALVLPFAGARTAGVAASLRF